MDDHDRQKNQDVKDLARVAGSNVSVSLEVGSESETRIRPDQADRCEDQQVSR